MSLIDGFSHVNYAWLIIKKIKILFAFFLLLPGIVTAQLSYKNYYALIDSAKYYTYAEPIKADSLYKVAFANYNPFSEDVVSAILNDYKIDSVLNYEYVELAIKQGEFYIDIKYYLKNIKYDKKKLKQVRKKAKRNKTINKNRKFRFKIIYLIFKDQYTRRFNKKNIIKRDSLNSIQLKLVLKKDSSAFSRFTLGNTYMKLLQVLLFHQGWACWNGKDFEMLVELVKRGHLNRVVISEIIERESIGNGQLFKIVNGKIVSKQMDYKKDMLGYHYYSSIGKRYYSKKGVNISVPVFPELNEDELDNLRHYLCYSTFSLYKKTYKHLLFPTPEEYLNIFYNNKNCSSENDIKK